MIVMGNVVVDDRELRERFVRAMGPDGQNPRRKATAVELRFDIDASSLPPDVKARFITLAGRHVTKKHELVIVSRRFRSQVRNREAVHEQFVDLLRRAVVGGAS
ncbi:MAG TPA: aminoacyl-tRNA hydrolase [Vicinamibacterales bacterium]|nr:aminoacyl-tRNA hydrolase [Vicinamibacterales bacterium]